MSVIESADEFRKNEETRVRKALGALNRTSVYDYFRGIDEILGNLENKRMELEAEETLRIEKLQEAKKFCEDAKKELEQIRTQVLREFENAEERRQKAVGYIEKEVPELFEHVKSLSLMKCRLKELQFANPFELELKNIELALHAKDYALCQSRYENSILDTSRVPETIRADFNEKANSLDGVLVSQLEKDLNQLFTKISYPFDLAVDLRAVKPHLGASIQILRLLRSIARRTDSRTDLEVLTLVTDVFERRFKFHFYGDKKTNNQARPEWFFSQVLQWISYNADYFEWNIEETADELFIGGLVECAKEKVRSLLSRSSFMANRVDFSHLLDETIAFSNEINELLGDSSCLPSIMSLFLDPRVLDQWVELERSAISVGVDELLEDPLVYKCRFEEAKDIDNFMVPNFANTFVILMRSMSERYMTVADPLIRSRFLKHQLLIIDEFLSRIARIFHETESPWSEAYGALMNAVWYIAVVLEDWGHEDQFVELSGVEPGHSLARGAFDESDELYRHEWRKRAKSLVNAFRQLIDLKIRPYAAEPWFQVNQSKPVDLTASMAPFVEELAARIDWTRDNISENSRLVLFKMLNYEVWDCLARELIATTSFTYRAAAQVLFDVETGLVPLLNKAFVPSTRNLSPESEFRHFDVARERRCVEVLSMLRLLSLNSPSAILLRDQVNRIPESMVAETLAPFNITNLDKDRVVALFEQRCDMHRIN